MPLYQFRCAACGALERSFPMAEVPETVPCPTCEQQAPRRITGAVLHGSSPARGLIERAERSAHEPGVVTSVPGGRGARGPARPVSHNPLHAKLPRPD